MPDLPAPDATPDAQAQDEHGHEPRALLRDWVRIAVEALAAKRAEIDALNVFPVPDGDTGTNVYLTMESSAAAVEQACADPEAGRAQVAVAMARGALLGARGNSGVILSQVLKGCTDVITELGEAPIAGTDVARMLQRGTELAYAAVATPVEGTILTVSREAAAAANRAAEARRGVRAVLQSAADAAEQALDATPQMLEALRRAGVVDAGGRALVVVLDALVDATHGTRTALGRPVGGRVPVDVTLADATDDAAPHTPDTCAREGYDGPAYEVMYLLDVDEADGTDAAKQIDARIDDLRADLGALGDSLVLVGDGPLWNVHVHVDEPGRAVEAGLRAGRPRDIRITYLLADGGPASTDVNPSGRGLVAVAHGPGVAEVLTSAGVQVIDAAPNVRPSAGEFLAAADAAGTGEVVLLPSDSDSRQAAELAAVELRGRGRRAAVIPTRSVVQTLAAVAMHDGDAAFDDAAVAMTRAAGATHYGAVTIASRAALTTAGPCEPGDVLGLVAGDIAFVGSDVATVTHDVVGALLAGAGELATFVFGVDADERLRQDVTAWTHSRFPTVEAVVIDGGQPLWPVIVGAE